ncbi:MAG: non-canonical purine NTP diphosphatase [Phaeodactylibacter sp.]|nr:non-canonical purine NTP diphosphatase [Phaeodactylibacter sp.]
MNQLVFGTGNPNKIREVNELLHGKLAVLSLDDINCQEDLPETQATIVGNALQKAQYLYEHYGYNCFSEDSGLEVDALGGEPGVYSARYAGLAKNSEANMDLVLEKLKGQSNRSAQFKSVIALIIDGKEYTFEGTVPGTIREARSGTGGFGYDPIFEPLGYSITFAEMDPAEKNRISHRGTAVRQLIDFLNQTFSLGL